MSAEKPIPLFKDDLPKRVARMRSAGKPIPKAWANIKTPKPAKIDAPLTKRELNAMFQTVSERIGAKRREVAQALGVPVEQITPESSPELKALYQERREAKRARKSAKQWRKDNHPKAAGRWRPRARVTRTVQYTYDQSDDARLTEFYASPEWKMMRYEALRLHGGHCQCCGASPDGGVVLNVDHIKPLRVFWDLRLEINNLQVLCGDCNEGKGARHADDWRPAATEETA